MLKLPTPLALQLGDGQLLRWQQAVPVTLRVLQGRVWVTRPGDPDDHFLDAGAALRLARGGGVLIGAEGAAQIAIEAERPAWRAALRRWITPTPHHTAPAPPPRARWPRAAARRPAPAPRRRAPAHPGR